MRRQDYAVLFPDSDIREGNRTRVYLHANVTRIWVFALLPATEFFIGICGIRGKSCSGLSIEQHLVSAICDFDLISVPDARNEPLVICVVLLAGSSTKLLHLINRAGAVVQKSVGLVLSRVSASLFVDLNLVAGIDRNGGGVTRHVGAGRARQHRL